MTDAELKALEAEVKAEGIHITGGGTFPAELVERCATAEQIAAGLAAAAEVATLANAKPQPATRIKGKWGPTIARLNAKVG